MTFMQNKVKIGNWICVALTLILMICQFTPFWTVPETGESESIAAYVAFPTEKGDLESYLMSEVGSDYNINSVIVGPALFILLGIVSILLCLIKSDIAACALAPAAAGCSAAWGYLTQTALKLGSGWGLHLVLAVLLIAAAVVTIVLGIKQTSK